ncbi:MAG: hypothetical protein C6P35_16510 [Cohnella sp.]|uniref:hypothetical protein n=1 Tax=Cohnella sp. TaxID=1883426 RepID=UPI000E380F9F|nr:hypothetical protein [Cohnella sp.]REK62035.1 MAG: hypothetical protein C6P35_16510 [Cohnella sp.]
MIKTKPKKVKYQQHGTLKHFRTFSGKEIWHFETEEESNEFEDFDLTAVLEDLSMDGWELVCPMIHDEGYILRNKCVKETTLHMFDTDDLTGKGRDTK